MSVLLVILGLVFGVINQASAVSRQATAKITSFQAARTAFDLLTDRLAEATLNSYWDYDNPAAPSRYLRLSQLHFLIGPAGTGDLPGTPGTGQAICFQLPAGKSGNPAQLGGLSSLLNACGFYVEYGPETPLPPPFAQRDPRPRYRLMMSLEKTENLRVYDQNAGSNWATDLQNNALSLQAPVAENIVYLGAWPRKNLSTDPTGDQLTAAFSYDSRLGATSTPQPETANQMPPLVQVLMVALDEESARRVCTGAAPPNAIENAFAGLFTISRQNAFEADLATLQDRLNAANLRFQIFSGMIPIRESKME